MYLGIASLSVEAEDTEHLAPHLSRDELSGEGQGVRRSLAKRKRTK